MLTLLWKKLINIGTEVDQSFYDQRQIRLLNQVSLIIFVASLFNLISDIIDVDEPGIVVTSIMLVLLLFTFLLQYLKYNNVAKIYFTLIITFGILVLICLIGKELRAEFAFFTNLMLVLVFFKTTKSRTTYFVTIIFCYIASQWYLANYESPMASTLTTITTHFMFFANIFSTILLTYAFVNENETNNTKNINLLEDLREKNESLKKHQKYIDEQNAKLESTNKELERFAFVASHDLKTPLRNITSFLQLLKRSLVKRNEQNGEILEYVDFATTNARQMHFLIQDILEYSRLNQKGGQYGEIDLNDIITQIKMNLKSYIEEENAMIEVSQLPCIKGNESQVKLLFQNLMENGIQYNESSEPQITIQSENTDSGFLISISDNGIGIEPQYSKKIFEMFTRLHTHEHYQGSGIGLAICQKIATHHGGFIEVDSKLNEGSTFNIYFPKAFILQPIEVAKEESIMV